MSHIDELIAEHCPHGVQFRTLGSLGKRNKGTLITAAKMKTLALVPGPIRVFAGGQTIADVAEDAVPSKNIVRVPSIIVKSRGHIGFTFYEKPFTHKSELWSYSIDHSDVDQKFVFYYLLTQVSKLQEIARATSVKLPQLGVKDTDTLKVPVPPLEIQREIVRILDTFSKLEAELEAELEARKQQYEHYRHSAFETSESVPHVPLGNLTRIKTGSAVSKRAIEDNPGQYPVINSGREPLGFIGTFNTENDPIGVTSRGAGVGSITWCNEPYFRGNLNYAVTIRDQKTMIVRYLFHALNHLQPEIQGLCTFQGIPALNKSNLEKLLIPVPSIDEQQRIVGFLDQLDSFVNDLSIGLPAELVARRQQYKYYRDKLLTFKELEPSS